MINDRGFLRLFRRYEEVYGNALDDKDVSGFGWLVRMMRFGV